MTLNFTLEFRVPPRVIYDALTDQQKVMTYTRSPAKVVAQEGSQFKMLDGKIEGKFLKLRAGEYIKMEWRFNDWKTFSTVEMILQEPDEDECQLIVNQTGLPANTNKEQLEAGWRNHILQPMSQILGLPLK